MDILGFFFLLNFSKYIKILLNILVSQRPFYTFRSRLLLIVNDVLTFFYQMTYFAFLAAYTFVVLVRTYPQPTWPEIFLMTYVFSLATEKLRQVSTSALLSLWWLHKCELSLLVSFVYCSIFPYQLVLNTLSNNFILKLFNNSCHHYMVEILLIWHKIPNNQLIRLLEIKMSEM